MTRPGHTTGPRLVLGMTLDAQALQRDVALLVNGDKVEFLDRLR
jgi:hypothetical protein